MVAPSSAGPGFKSRGCRITVWPRGKKSEKFSVWVLGLKLRNKNAFVSELLLFDNLLNLLEVVPLEISGVMVHSFMTAIQTNINKHNDNKIMALCKRNKFQRVYSATL